MTTTNYTIAHHKTNTCALCSKPIRHHAIATAAEAAYDVTDPGAPDYTDITVIYYCQDCYRAHTWRCDRCGDDLPNHVPVLRRDRELDQYSCAYCHHELRTLYGHTRHNG